MANNPEENTFVNLEWIQLNSTIMTLALLSAQPNEQNHHHPPPSSPTLASFITQINFDVNIWMCAQN